MVVVHRAFGSRFSIYTRDHEPTHVHITGAGQAKDQSAGLGRDGRPELVYSIGISRADLRRIMTEVVAEQARLLEEWKRTHG
jgi:hypothetical protein